MLTAAVFSDTHGNTAHMLEAMRDFRPDRVFHLGDCVSDADRLRTLFPEVPLTCVRGNCDSPPAAPASATVEFGGVRIFLTHGHEYGVKYSVDSLVYAAQEAGARLALFGHTHEALNVEIAGVQLLNPGSAGLGRQQSWGVVRVFENGGFASEIRWF